MKKRPLLIALGANAAFLVVEVVGGLLFDSLAVLADAADMTSDVLALAVAYAALVVSQRPPTDRHTYGFSRTEVLAAECNGLLLLVSAAVIGFEAIRRLDDPQSIEAGGVLVIGLVGLAINAGSALVLFRVSHGDLNIRAAFWHLTADAAGSLLVVATGLGSMLFDVDRLDPIASLAIAAMVLFAAIRLLRDTTRVLLEAVPSGVDLVAVRDAIAGAEGVNAVHHLHVWSIGSSEAALSAHVVLAGELSLHDAQERATRLKEMLHERFEITHATLEVECHECAADDHVIPTASPAHHH